MKTPLLVLILLLAGLCCGCQKFLATVGWDYDLERQTSNAVEELLSGSKLALSLDHPVLVATVVNIDRLETSSSFGPTMADYIAASLVRRGYTALELQLRDSIAFDREAGVLLLSRDIRRLSGEHQAQAVIVGSYTLGDKLCYITLRLVHAADNVILAATSFTIPLGSETRTMLGYTKLAN